MAVRDLAGISENSVLPTGIFPFLGSKQLSLAEDYMDEVAEFFKSPEYDLPFVNQEKTFMQVLRSLNTPYPYALILGEPGIGKSTVIDYIVGAISGTIGMGDVKKHFPEGATLLESLIPKLEKYQNRDFILLPHLENPSVVPALDYNDDSQADLDFEVVNQFFDDINFLFESYSRSPETTLSRRFSKEQFERYVEFEVLKMFNTFYAELVEVEKNTKTNLKTLSVVDIDIPKNLKGPILGKAEFLVPNMELLSPEDGFLRYIAAVSEKKEMDLDSLLELASSQTISDYFDVPYFRLNQKIIKANIEGIDEKEKNTLFRKVFIRTSKSLTKDIKKSYEAREIRTNKDAHKYIQEISYLSYPKVNIDDSTLDEIITSLHEIKETYSGKEMTDALHSRIDSICDYFMKNPKILQNSLRRLYEELEDCELSDNPLNKVTKKGKIDLEIPSFEFSIKIPHGSKFIDISDIMESNYLGSENASTSGVRWAGITNTNIESMFGSFDCEEEYSTPHMAMTCLGPFFEAGLLVYRDSFGDFIKSIVTTQFTDMGNKPGRLSMEQFLEYLQTQIIRVVNKGVTYEFRSPKMILAADTKDPFSVRDFIEREDQSGLRGRFHTIYMPDTAANTKEARKGTLSVIYKTAQKENLQRSDDKKFILKEDGAHLFLQSTILSSKMLDLHYRELTQYVQDVLAYADSRGRFEIDAESIKDMLRHQIPPAFFEQVDSEADEGNYFDMADSQVGAMNGLALSMDNSGSLVKVRSYFLSGRLNGHDESHFSLVDQDNLMIDKTMGKGYSLAVDYISRLFDEYGIGEKKSKAFDLGWKIKTHFKEWWGNTGGPSASTAMAISMLSALADEPIYKNRFITGTLDPAGVKGGISADSAGHVGVIGGTYFKALVVARLKDISPLQGEKNSPFYFLFPVGNLRDLTAELRFDAYSIEDKITSIPVSTFAQAYYLATCGLDITLDQMKNSNEYSQRTLKNTMEKVRSRFTDDKISHKTILDYLKH